LAFHDVFGSGAWRLYSLGVLFGLLAMLL
jgi:hypothetical protein